MEQAQVLTKDALRLGLAFAWRSSPRLWVSFNTIGAGASVNHLHLHGGAEGCCGWEGFKAFGHCGTATLLVS